MLCASLAFAASSAPAPPPLQVVVVSGSDYEMGVQYGEQAAPLIAANRDQVWNLMLNTPSAWLVEPVDEATILQDFKVWDYYVTKYDPALHDWMNGMIQGAANKGVTISYQDMEAILYYLDEIWARPATPYPAETGVSAALLSKPLVDQQQPLLAQSHKHTNGKGAVASCTAFVATGSATQGKVPMESITLGAATQVTNYLVIIAYPAKGLPFIGITQAGRVLNNSGMNTRFAWNMTAAVTAPWTACASNWGMPPEANFHWLSEYATTPTAALNYVNSSPIASVSGNYMIADNSGQIYTEEAGGCATQMLSAGSSNFIAHNNHYVGSNMAQYDLPPEYFPDTFYRYATITQELTPLAAKGQLGLNTTKNLWLQNSWYDYINNAWNTVPVPNDPNDANTCNVPSNTCEGGLTQVIQFPSLKTTYLEMGNPQGTSIANYWPASPLPTGQYTKWQLQSSAFSTGWSALLDAGTMVSAASQAVSSKAFRSLSSSTQAGLMQQLAQANNALEAGVAMTMSSYGIRDTNARMADLGAAYTQFATAQLDAQMISAAVAAATK